MKKTTLLLICFLNFGIGYSQDTKTIAKNVLNSTTSIISKDANFQILGLGSGFIIGDGLVVTNVHVIEGAKSIYIKQNNSSIEIKSTGYVAIDKINDLVILKIPSLIGQSLSFSYTNPEIGEVVYVGGNPSGLTGTFSDGLISGIRTFDNRKLIQISAPISPGSSGGPVVNKNSELIGISVGGMKEGQNLNFCIPVEYLIKLKQNIGALSSFNLAKSVEDKNSAYSGIREGVTVRDIHFKDSYHGYELESLSVFNNLSQPIKNVKLLFIVYDAEGVPVDTHEETFFKSEYGDKKMYQTQDGYRDQWVGGQWMGTQWVKGEVTYSISTWGKEYLIQPKLAKREEFSAWGYCKMNPTDKMEIRVLDFVIVED